MFDKNSRLSCGTRLILLPILILVIPPILLSQYLGARSDAATYIHAPVRRSTAPTFSETDSNRYLAPARVTALTQSGVRTTEYHAALTMENGQELDAWLPDREFWERLSNGSAVTTEIWRGRLTKVVYNGRSEPTQGTDGDPTFQERDLKKWAPMMLLIVVVMAGVWLMEFREYRSRTGPWASPA